MNEPFDIKYFVLSYIKSNNNNVTTQNIEEFILATLNIKDKNPKKKIATAIHQLVDEEKIQINNDKTFYIVKHDKTTRNPTMEIKHLEKMILDFIRSNNASCNLNALYDYLIPFMKEVAEPTVFIMPVVRGLITSEKIRINQIGMFEIIEENPKMKEENPMNTETKQPVFTISEEQSKILLLIKERFKIYFGIDLTFEQTMDRAFRIVQEHFQTNPNMFAQQPINAASLNPSNFSDWVRPPGWNEGVAKCGNSFNAPQHFNQMSYPGQPHQSSYPNEPQSNTQAMREGIAKAGLLNAAIDFNTLLREKPQQFPQHPTINPNFVSSEGPYARLYPGFVNIILPQREYSPNKTFRDSEPKKKRSYKTKSAKN